MPEVLHLTHTFVDISDSYFHRSRPHETSRCPPVVKSHQAQRSPGTVPLVSGPRDFTSCPPSHWLPCMPPPQIASDFTSSQFTSRRLLIAQPVDGVCVMLSGAPTTSLVKSIHSHSASHPRFNNSSVSQHDNSFRIIFFSTRLVISSLFCFPSLSFLRTAVLDYSLFLSSIHQPCWRGKSSFLLEESDAFLSLEQPLR